MVGPAYLEASASLFPAALAAAAFTLSYLLATVLAGLGDRKGIWFMLATAVVQLIAMQSMITSGTADVSMLIALKLKFQTSAAVLLIVYTAIRLHPLNSRPL
jgi:hypothetical protein